jgi:hypothetical protein
MKLRGGRVLALLVELAWFYTLLAVLSNPVYVPPSIPSNPIMPFLSAYAVNQLWPIVLLSSPIALIIGQQFVRSPGGRRREVSPEEFARIQARVRATRAQTREEVSRPEPNQAIVGEKEATTTRTRGTSSESKSAERKAIVAEGRLLSPKTTSETVSTPPLMTPPSQESTSARVAGTVNEVANKPTVEESEVESQEEREARVARRIDELEAERAAIATLMDRLEDMRRQGSVQPDLYDKLKKKYVSELQRINAKVERLPVNEEIKKKLSKVILTDRRSS